MAHGVGTVVENWQEEILHECRKNDCGWEVKKDDAGWYIPVSGEIFGNVYFRPFCGAELE